VNNQGVIQMLDSALEMEGGGIYVGTQTIIPIPEPGFLCLSACGVLTLCWRFRWLNPAAPGNGAIASLLHAGRRRRAVPEQQRFGIV
jgi:hypothetical protein